MFQDNFNVIKFSFLRNSQEYFFDEGDIEHSEEKAFFYPKTMERLSNLYYDARIQSKAENPWYNEMVAGGITAIDVKLYLYNRILDELYCIEQNLLEESTTVPSVLKKRRRVLKTRLRRLAVYARSADWENPQKES